MGLIMSKNIANIVLSCIFHEKSCGNLFPRIEKMVSMVSRSGRHLQRYDGGRRQVVGYVYFFFSFFFVT